MLKREFQCHSNIKRTEKNPIPPIHLQYHSATSIHGWFIRIIIFRNISFDIERENLEDVFVYYSCSVHSLNIQLFHASQVYNACNQITKVANHYQNSQAVLFHKHVDKPNIYLVSTFHNLRKKRIQWSVICVCVWGGGGGGGHK